MSMTADHHKGGDSPGRRPYLFVYADYHNITNKPLSNKELTP